MEHNAPLILPLSVGRLRDVSWKEPVDKGAEGVGSPLMVILSGLSETWANKCSALRRSRDAHPRRTCSLTRVNNSSAQFAEFAYGTTIIFETIFPNKIQIICKFLFCLVFPSFNEFQHCAQIHGLFDD